MEINWKRVVFAALLGSLGVLAWATVAHAQQGSYGRTPAGVRYDWQGCPRSGYSGQSGQVVDGILASINQAPQCHFPGWGILTWGGQWGYPYYGQRRGNMFYPRLDEFGRVLAEVAGSSRGTRGALLGAIGGLGLAMLTDASPKKVVGAAVAGGVGGWAVGSVTGRSRPSAETETVLPIPGEYEDETVQVKSRAPEVVKPRSSAPPNLPTQPQVEQVEPEPPARTASEPVRAQVQEEVITNKVTPLECQHRGRLRVENASRVTIEVTETGSSARMFRLGPTAATCVEPGGGFSGEAVVFALGEGGQVRTSRVLMERTIDLDSLVFRLPTGTGRAGK